MKNINSISPDLRDSQLKKNFESTYNKISNLKTKIGEPINDLFNENNRLLKDVKTQTNLLSYYENKTEIKKDGDLEYNLSLYYNKNRDVDNLIELYSNDGEKKFDDFNKDSKYETPQEEINSTRDKIPNIYINKRDLNISGYTGKSDEIIKIIEEENSAISGYTDQYDYNESDIDKQVKKIPDSVVDFYDEDKLKSISYENKNDYTTFDGYSFGSGSTILNYYQDKSKFVRVNDLESEINFTIKQEKRNLSDLLIYKETNKEENSPISGYTDQYDNNESVIDKIPESTNGKRDLNYTGVDYKNIKLTQNQDKYNQEKGYYNPDEKSIFTTAAESITSLLSNGTVGVSIGNGFNIESDTLKTATSLPIRMAEVGASYLTNLISPNILLQSDLAGVGLVNLSTTLLGSGISKLLIQNKQENFLKETKIGIDNADFNLEEKENDSSSIFQKIFGSFEKAFSPYKINEIVNQGDDIIKNESIWLNEILESTPENDVLNTLEKISFSPQSLLYKTQKMFESGKIKTMTTKLISSDEKTFKGRNLKTGNNIYRNWSATNQYNKINALIRPFSEDNTNTLNKNLERVRPGQKILNVHGVLQDDGFIKIAPYSEDKFEDKNDPKKYMFSIENLAWKGSIDSLIEGTSQEGPNGGRIMWFPPYDISFNEVATVNLNRDTFIGRGEPVYTYVDTERNGTLNFKLIVDHPSILNYYNQTDKKNELITDDDYLKLMSGDEVLLLEDQITEEQMAVKKPRKKPNNPKKTVSFKIYFPSYLSGVNLGSSELIKYLYAGVSCKTEGGGGYEMVGTGLTPTTQTGACHDNFYYKVDEEYKNLTGITNSNNYKDTISFQLNSTGYKKGGNVDYSFKQVYESLNSNSGEIAKIIATTTKITLIASSDQNGTNKINNELCENRNKMVNNWLSDYNETAKRETIIGYQQGVSRTEESNNIINKKDRFVKVILHIDSESDQTPAELVNEENLLTEDQISSGSTGNIRPKKSFYGYYYDKNNPNSNQDNKIKRTNDESEFFKKIGESQDSNFIFDKLSEKIKYFHPAFHSTTPEGFNSRLTFLNQCTRQGPTMAATDQNNGSATNMAFGRPPICILRLGDFYNTKIFIDALNITYDPLVWDLNQEGIGVQPMVANVTMNFKFLGGSDLTGPIARLQNAITFNFFANTGVYDDRNDRIIGKDENGKDIYDNLYNPPTTYDKPKKNN